jgi:chemotaxis methyl-accepting protein methylase
MTKLDRSIGHALRLVRDTGVTIVGMRAEEPEIILEPGEQWIEFAMAALGIDDKADYDRAMSAGKLGRRLRRDERERQGTLLKQIRAEHQAEVAELVADLKLAERKAFTSNPITLQQQLQEARRLQKRAEDENRALRLRLQISG